MIKQLQLLKLIVLLPKGSRAMALVAGGGYAVWIEMFVHNIIPEYRSLLHQLLQEYCAVPIGQLMHIPAGMSFEEAAAIPEAWLTAWQVGRVFEEWRRWRIQKMAIR